MAATDQLPSSASTSSSSSSSSTTEKRLSAEGESTDERHRQEPRTQKRQRKTDENRPKTVHGKPLASADEGEKPGELSEAAIEEQHVHRVYSAIADHFHETRFSLWPLVADFLASVPAGSLVADVGCGNGKYLACIDRKKNSPSFIVGSDRCRELLETAATRGACLQADNLGLPFRSGTFDAVISIAVIHHFASEARRREALAELLRVLRPGGRVMVSVWAFEQERRVFESQDSLIPWMYRGKPDETFQRFYHLFKKGELEELASSIGNVEVEHSVWDYDNWYCIFKKT